VTDNITLELGRGTKDVEDQLAACHRMMLLLRVATPDNGALERDIVCQCR
jgi:hypothetical protein